MAESDNRIRVKLETEDIFDDLKRIRNGDSMERTQDFIATILDINFVKENFQYIQISSQQYVIAWNQYDDFCNAYLKSIFLKFLSVDDAEIMLMAYGFLDGYDDNNLRERRKKYWENAHKTNKCFKRKKRKDKDNLLREIENDIIKRLSNILIDIVNEPEKMSDFTNRVYENFSSNKIPKKIPLPIPDYLVNNPSEVVTPNAVKTKVQHYRVITYKVSICGIVMHNHETKIPIDGNVDEEDEQIFDISKELITAVLASIVCLILIILVNKPGQDSNSSNILIAEEYSMEPLRNDTPEEGQKKQAWIPVIAPCKEVISKGTVSGSVEFPK